MNITTLSKTIPQGFDSAQRAWVLATMNHVIKNMEMLAAEIMELRKRLKRLEDVDQ